MLVTSTGQVKLLDFSIAKLLEDEAPAASALLTQEIGSAMTPITLVGQGGTPGYTFFSGGMPPGPPLLHGFRERSGSWAILFRLLGLSHVNWDQP